MIISQSSLSFGSTRSYSRTEKTKIKQVSPDMKSGMSFFKGDIASGKSEKYGTAASLIKGNSTTATNVTEVKDKEDNYRNLKHKMLMLLLDHLFKRRTGGIEDTNAYNSEGTGIIDFNSEAVSLNSITRQETVSYYEYEETSFSGQAELLTGDGRSISIDVNVTMSRSFYAEVSRTYEIYPFTDPLVVNLDGDVPDIDSMDFFFDLNADGEEESISALGPGSGFLALDLNEDGIINDGSELFGARTGNGFAELSKYDKDGNNFIDEADDIFNMLKVWVKMGTRDSKLLSLKEAGIGAISLSYADTEFSLNNKEDNSVNARIRKTGFFLYEQGMAGTIQHVDFAAKG